MTSSPGARVVLPFGTGRIAWIDPDDIAAVAAVALTRDIDGSAAPHRPRVTRRRRGRGAARSRAGWTRRSRTGTSAVVASGLDPWLADSTVELYAAVARGALDRRVARCRARPRAARRVAPSSLRTRASSPAAVRTTGAPAHPLIRDRRRGSSDTASQPGSPSRANAAHAVRSSRPRRSASPS